MVYVELIFVPGQKICFKICAV